MLTTHYPGQPSGFFITLQGFRLNSDILKDNAVHFIVLKLAGAS